jgi:uncharacterized protein YciI
MTRYNKDMDDYEDEDELAASGPFDDGDGDPTTGRDADSWLEAAYEDRFEPAFGEEE